MACSSAAVAVRRTRHELLGKRHHCLFTGWGRPARETRVDRLDGEAVELLSFTALPRHQLVPGTPCIASHSVVGGPPYIFAPVCFAMSGASAM